MDRSWITKSRASGAYVRGVAQFLDFAFSNASRGGRILCPCINCCNKMWKTREVVTEHLICDGFLSSYTLWFCHGESLPSPPSSPDCMPHADTSGASSSQSPPSSPEFVPHADTSQASSSQTEPQLPMLASVQHQPQPSPQPQPRAQPQPQPQPETQPEPSSSELQPSNTENGTNTSSSKSRRKRGHTRMDHVWKRKDDNRIQVPIDSRGQPYGAEAQTLSEFIGTVVKKPMYLPLLPCDWHRVPNHHKMKALETIHSHFEIEEAGHKWLDVGLARSWRNWKNQLKRNHYDTHATDEERYADLDERVDASQWHAMVDYWRSPEGKVRSAINKSNRAKQRTTHTAGTKSFSRIRAEMEKELGREPSRSEVWIKGHKNKDGKPMNDYSREKIKQMEDLAYQQPEESQTDIAMDDVLAQVMGDERHGRVRTFGAGLCPSKVFGAQRSRVALIRSHVAERQAWQEEKERWQQERQAWQQERDALREEWDKMRSRIEAIEALIINKEQLRQEAGQEVAVPQAENTRKTPKPPSMHGLIQLQDDNLSASSHEIPPKQMRVRRKRKARAGASRKVKRKRGQSGL